MGRRRSSGVYHAEITDRVRSLAQSECPPPAPLGSPCLPFHPTSSSPGTHFLIQLETQGHPAKADLCPTGILLCVALDFLI